MSKSVMSKSWSMSGTTFMYKEISTYNDDDHWKLHENLVSIFVPQNAHFIKLYLENLTKASSGCPCLS